MPLEDGTFGVGGVVFPLGLNATTGQSLLRDGDPTVYLLIEYVRTILQTYLGARWTEAATAAGLPAVMRPNVVLGTVPTDPGPYLKQNQFKFPLLAVYRESSKTEDVTLDLEHDVWSLSVAWVLPPLEVSQLERLDAFRHLVAKTIRRLITKGWDASYNGGAPPFTHLESIGVTKTTLANAPGVGPGDLIFPTVLIDLEVIEIDEPVDGAFDPIDGGDIGFDLNPEDALELAGFSATSTDTRAFSSAFSHDFD